MKLRLMHPLPTKSHHSSLIFFHFVFIYFLLWNSLNWFDCCTHDYLFSSYNLIFLLLTTTVAVPSDVPAGLVATHLYSPASASYIQIQTHGFIWTYWIMKLGCNPMFCMSWLKHWLRKLYLRWNTSNLQSTEISRYQLHRLLHLL